MNPPIILAQVLGIIFTVSGLSLFINKKVVNSVVEGITQNQGLLWLYGFVVLAMGAVIIGLNNFWTSGLRLLITVIGWLAVLKGVFILILPNSAVSFYRKLNTGSLPLVGGVVAFILGLLLLYKGFM